jgi:hypothetical protein
MRHGALHTLAYTVTVDNPVRLFGAVAPRGESRRANGSRPLHPRLPHRPPPHRPGLHGGRVSEFLGFWFFYGGAFCALNWLLSDSSDQSSDDLRKGDRS